MKPTIFHLELSLAEARTAIAERIAPLEQECIPLTEALARVCAAFVFAARPSPSCDQSARDGFALATQPLFADQAVAAFHISGEIAAGCTEQKRLAPGQAFRIMTGAAIPTGTARVVPFEVCQEKDGKVLVPLAELARKQLHIRRQGCEVQTGQLLAAARTRLLPDHLLLLAENGCEEIVVHRQPRVAVICTGTELTQAGEPLLPGCKISGNGALLAALLQTQHCTCICCLTVEDNAERITALIEQIIDRDQPDLLISTGGMGPGTFDLTEQVFARLGGVSVYNRLRVRPGRSTLFGLLDKVPFFGLPGPPPAVRLLFHELVAPAIVRLHGEEHSGGMLKKAILDGPALLSQADCTVLKGAVARVDEEGRLRVRLADRLEPLNAILHLNGEEGELVSVRLIGPLA
ncbi:MAG: molybdopterin molybdochelatase [Candidatus Electronema aureum]|uniref:Molybdopterin molybdenumtransferase n=1 Tax=Candidatus Electronema aureum TaxID=2005002 RepID=A0A521G3F2_9BACT|nr:MAG: molybdopterin molybdochelatase [Candidatus Electronema aureum]